MSRSQGDRDPSEVGESLDGLYRVSKTSLPVLTNPIGLELQGVVPGTLKRVRGHRKRIIG